MTKTAKFSAPLSPARYPIHRFSFEQFAELVAQPFMKTSIAIFLLFSLALGASASHAQSTYPDGILKSIENANVTLGGDKLQLTAKNPHSPLEIVFDHCQGLGVHYDHDQWWVLPISETGAAIDANRALWVLPLDATSRDHSWHIELHNGTLHTQKTNSGLTVTIQSDSVTLSRAEARPHSDSFGNTFSLDFADGPQLAQTLAAFYWGTMLPSVVERTMAANFPYSSGYVLSTLNVHSYAGSYPAVDHEFQIKGRLAMASPADLDLVKRMIELQFKLMRDDPEHLYRAPTSVQPDGTREYHVRRNSLNNKTNAAMFPLTGNIEVIEEASNYYLARKDTAWLRSNIDNLEHAAGWILANTDQYGRVWSDVYYEDQVMKDGRETEAQAFAAHALQLLADLERRLDRADQAAHFAATAKQMSAVLIAPLPLGYWDAPHQRFVDWIDRNGQVHDHIHLLANELPVTFGYATAGQAIAVHRLIAANDAEFERFPSFLAVDIADYDKSEIGDGGPYDLCAAGRYWYWDAAYRQFEKQPDMLLAQLKTVAAEAAKDNYFMSERYDMDHVYYIDGKNFHGAEKYYEYPNTFAAVLITKYLGLTTPAEADLAVAPLLKSYGSVEFRTPAYAVRYSFSDSGFVLKNLSDHPRRIEVDLSGLGSASTHYRLQTKSTSSSDVRHLVLTLAAQEEARWTPE